MEKKANSKNKDKVVAFRLSSEDFIQFEEKLAASNMKKSEFFREVFLNSNVNITVKAGPSKDLERLTFLFNKASNNLNQLAHQVNSAHLSGQVSERLYKTVNNVLVDIRTLLLSGVKDVD
ncbi:bacterial mobilization protein (MobC) [Escherichia coli M056]|uniref:plasmid mobilization protein n=1 Tax=Escherichia coli TaxID=562 RepID=UPI000A183B05|nr:plasmid mobilization relaxosome protein MobC [Escherichia coli]OSK14531.1 bacterial mobilization protein (MobC) [Escherichia coli M056]